MYLVPLHQCVASTGELKTGHDARDAVWGVSDKWGFVLPLNLGLAESSLIGQPGDQ